MHLFVIKNKIIIKSYKIYKVVHRKRNRRDSVYAYNFSKQSFDKSIYISRVTDFGCHLKYNLMPTLSRFRDLYVTYIIIRFLSRNIKNTIISCKKHKGLLVVPKDICELTSVNNYIS